MHDRKVGIEQVAQLLGRLCAAHIRAHDAEVVEPEPLEVIGEEVECRQVIDRLLEEPLNLPLVQVDGRDGIDTGRLEHAGDELGGDGLARGRLAILTGVAIMRDDGMDSSRTCTTGSIGHDKQLHESVVDVTRNRLDEEDILATNGFHEARVGLAVRELLERDVTQLDIEMPRHLLGELRIYRAREDV